MVFQAMNLRGNVGQRQLQLQNVFIELQKRAFKLKTEHRKKRNAFILQFYFVCQFVAIIAYINEASSSD